MGISQSYGAIVTQAPYNFGTSGGFTTFNFKGKFSDINTTQVFKITYNATGGQLTKDFTFTKVKSIFNGEGITSCSQMQPNYNVITAPKCIISTTHLTFPAIKYYNQDVSPQACFGTITKYE